MDRTNDIVEGEPTPRFRVRINGIMQDEGFDTFDEARASVTRLDLNVEIFEGRTRVFGKELPYLPPRPHGRKRRV